MIYKFRDGSRLKGDAQAVGVRLTSIRENNGRLAPIDVVNEARAKESLLHQYFEWDNSKAAEQHRLAQARHLVAAVVIVETEEHGEISPIRAFAKLYGDEGYQTIQMVLTNPDMRRRALLEIRRGIKTLKDKMENFEEFADLIGALDTVEAIATTHLGQEVRTSG